WTSAVGRTVTPVGKPDAGNQHVRFDERGRKTERTLQGSATASVLDSTIVLERVPLGWPQRHKAPRLIRPEN
ncbi:MAG TPA: hypothetical protein VGY55_21350, partial [Pirellulales bacterium]|nr:hypothetical protein [Pirellulales bacterium]